MGHVADIFTSACWRRCPASWPSATRAIPPPAIRCCSTRSRFRWPATRASRGGAQRQHHQRQRNCAPTWSRAAPSSRHRATPKSILHLVAHSSERTLAGALRDALLQLEGAFSLVFLAQDRIIVARDPHGFRPLAVGEMEFSGGRQVLRVRLGNLRVRPDRRGLPERSGAGRDGHRRPGRHHPRTLGARAGRARSASSSTCIFRAPIPIVFGRAVEESRENLGRLLARECPADADLVVPVPDSGVAGGHRLFGRVRPPVPPGADPQSLRGPHVHRAVAGHSRFRSQAQAQPRAATCCRASA